jgi:transcriptional regulator with PAS, ATPase and Fis domain
MLDVLALKPNRSEGIDLLDRPLHSTGSISLDTSAQKFSKAPARASAMVFCDPCSLKLKADLDRFSPSQASILIAGETGTGKELVARYIHAHSPRRNGPFIAVNCGALSDTLAEAELFGHERGAFTGALKTQAGWFEAAHGGTIFLDEIGDLPLPLQVKLLRVLQEREVVRVGSRHALPINIRVIAATNVDLEAAIEARHFREDLYFRLNVASVRLAPLRERPGDIIPLAQHFLGVYRDRLDRNVVAFSPEALQMLKRYDWPGNIREMENVVHAAILLARSSVIDAGDLRFTGSAHKRSPEALGLEEKIKAQVERAILDGEDDIFARATRSIVMAGFDLASGNQVKTAEKLGISRNALRTQLANLGAIQRRRRREPPMEDRPAV